RNALAADVTVKGATLRVVSAHLTWTSGGGLRETQALLDGLRSEGANGQEAVLIAADLNAAEDEPPVRLLLGEGFVDVARQTCGEGGPCLTATPQLWQGNGPGGPGFNLTSRLDYQLLRLLPGVA